MLRETHICCQGKRTERSGRRDCMDYHYKKIAAANFEVTVGNPMGNAEKILRMAAEEFEKGTDILVFPELALTGYTCGDLFLQSYLQELVWEAVNRLIHGLPEQMITVVGLPVRADGRLFNAAAVFNNKSIAGIVPKSFIPNYGEFYEKRWFTPAAERLNDILILQERVQVTEKP